MRQLTRTIFVFLLILMFQSTIAKVVIANDLDATHLDSEDLENLKVSDFGENSGLEFFPGYRKYDSRVSTADISVPLLKVSSDAMDGTLILQLVTDSMNNLQELKYVRADNVTVDMHPADLLRGVVLMSNKDPITGRAFDVLKLIAHDIRPESGGDLELSYLSNRFGWRYASFFMTLLQTQGSWSLQTQDSSGHKTQFNTMYLKKRTLANVTVGIKSVSVSFQASH